MKFLISTEPDDRHALLVKLALEDFGHYVRLLFGGDQPTRQQNSVYINNDFYHWNSIDEEGCESDDIYDVVWWRSASEPYVPADWVHPEAHRFVTQQNQLFYESLTSNMAPNAWWVNTKEAANRANNPLLQLKTAAACGLTIPLTLCSNHPEDIRYFLLKYEVPGVIYKPLLPAERFEDPLICMASTKKIGFLELPDSGLLQLSPGLFQQQVNGSSAVKVVCFGDYQVAVQLDLEVPEKGRPVKPNKATLRPFAIPPLIQEKIARLQQALGIVFCTVDLVINERDEFVLIDLKEQGDFLWIESVNPEIKMLDMFVNFLINGSPHFNWDPSACEHTIERYEQRVPGLIVKQLRQHVDLHKVGWH